MNDHDQHLYKLHTSNNNANTVVTCLKIIKLWSQNNNCKSNDKNIKQREKKNSYSKWNIFFSAIPYGFFLLKKVHFLNFCIASYCSTLNLTFKWPKYSIRFDTYSTSDKKISIFP